MNIDSYITSTMDGALASCFESEEYLSCQEKSDTAIYELRRRMPAELLPLLNTVIDNLNTEATLLMDTAYATDFKNGTRYCG